ncbi:uncharacterized protein BDV17DRAFT_131864 [Aspergillus undulatus]|uniref:uncharacterized protein n=1 Tax=Aspergillus undulatus TaxID=1810928 RepID=UPI003CCD48B7
MEGRNGMMLCSRRCWRLRRAVSLSLSPDQCGRRPSPPAMTALGHVNHPRSTSTSGLHHLDTLGSQHLDMPRVIKPPRKPSQRACVKCRTLRVRCVRRDDGKPCAKCIEAGVRCMIPKPGQFIEPDRSVIPPSIKCSAEDRANMERLGEMNAKLEHLMQLLRAKGFLITTSERSSPLAHP